MSVRQCEIWAVKCRLVTQALMCRWHLGVERPLGAFRLGPVVFPTDPLERVRTGLEVVDVAGRRLGTVARVQLAATPVTHPPDSDLLDEMVELAPAPPDVAEVSGLEAIGPSPLGHDPAGLPELPEPLRSHLQQVGFVEIEGEDLAQEERFVPGDHIVNVGEDRLVVRQPE